MIKQVKLLILKTNIDRKGGEKMYWVHKLRKIEVEHVLEFLKKNLCGHRKI